MLIKPKRLEAGDTIGIIAPASAPPDPKTVDRSVGALERLGFKVKLAPNVRKRHGFLAGSDRDRAGDLMRAFSDRRVDAILCIRGGYGTARLLPLLDYGVIQRNAKIFVGYSDITSLHCALLVKARLISFHGPMLNSDFVKADMPGFTLKSFLRVLSPAREPERRSPTRLEPTRTSKRAGSEIGAPILPAPGGICQGYRRKTVKILRRGTARGALIGGNLSLLCTTLGTPWQPSFNKRILFFEDISEQPYRVDRLLTHLLNCGLLQQVAGIAIGINAECSEPKAKGVKEYRQTIEDVIKERLLPLKIPIVTGLPFGHVPHNATMPVGAEAILDAENGDLLFLDAAVS
jgi:muramoyltetrapeptide carboxypeptidase